MKNKESIYDPAMLRAARKRLGLSLQQAGERLGMTRQAVHKYEAGKVHLDAQKIERFSRAYHIPESAFYKPVVQVVSLEIVHVSKACRNRKP